jgi:integrative and conjugative element protein (TIGR02256 family)
MQLLLTSPITQRLQRELRKAGRREIGGLLMGEHVQGEVFRVVELTVQHSGGTTACFIRHPHEHQAELERFFERTGADYKRFNYLGEWHSHPSFAPLPSETDVQTMQSIVSDPSVGANFLILLIVKLAGRQTLQISATAFRPDALPIDAGVVLEDADASTLPCKMPLLRWISQLFRR